MCEVFCLPLIKAVLLLLKEEEAWLVRTAAGFWMTTAGRTNDEEKAPELFSEVEVSSDCLLECDDGDGS